MIDKKVRSAVVKELIAESDARLANLQAELEKERMRRESLSALPEVAESKNGAEHVKPAKKRRRKGKKTLADSIVQILKEHTDGMRSTDIAKKLLESGESKKVHKELLPNVISALRRKDDLFENVERGVYRLKK